MKVIADTHCHTIASSHAYSTVLENAKFASEIGLKYLAITDHAPEMTDSPHFWHFVNMKTIPNELFGVKILKGAEVNILNSSGDIDLDDYSLSYLNWIVASLHEPTFQSTSINNNTQAYLNIAKNPKVDVIGHSGNPNYVYDYEKVIKSFKEYNKLVEINQNSLHVRAGSLTNCEEIAKLCKKYEVKVIVNSDAHFAYSIGQVDDALKLLSDIDFPEHLIVNSTVERFEEYLNNRA
ncbi:phosphatase [Paludicola sp. MB14-C6]|uniref:phosphatase n=1 Tax=Paludihabitans sp. MB14-C6 TaxID=3070656 RepID=UPI0027DB5307|nr:phosphatase [Paludicola sp. MB14-C6]WMJ23495.1 phosphatase [Paludicola sp. MB14-C6]